MLLSFHLWHLYLGIKDAYLRIMFCIIIFFIFLSTGIGFQGSKVATFEGIKSLGGDIELHVRFIYYNVIMFRSLLW